MITLPKLYMVSILGALVNLFMLASCQTTESPGIRDTRQTTESPGMRDTRQTTELPGTRDTVWLVDTGGLRSPAMIALATDYARGDYAAVLRDVRPLAESGDGEAQAYLAHLYDTGRGVPKDAAEATKWRIRAAKNGIPVAQRRLAVQTFLGNGVPRDEKEAIRLLTAAAQQNDTYAIERLGRAYQQGNGVVRDTAEAMKWFRRGVALNSGLSMWNIGFAMMLELGVPGEVVEGYKWMTLGIKYLEPGADPKQFRAELAFYSNLKMTPAQRAEGERRARAWRPGDDYEQSLIDTGLTPLAPRANIPNMHMFCFVGENGRRISIYVENKNFEDRTCRASCSYTDHGQDGVLGCSDTIPARANRMIFCTKSSFQSNFVFTGKETMACE